ncbi:hypothetical protein ACFV6B_40980 [Streptomyces microflavus]|uniref:hypothetical protein n=1 Tax=Streptomyces TaxID=1883 RepID=UPI0019142959|nr:hypothetical protein [Streptomyces sp. MBT58]MBK5993346.1 hypothetical protein [Streptomyces sp. MBT58]
MNDMTTYWAYTVTFDATTYSGALETKGIARDFLPDALLPGILNELSRQAPQLRGRTHEDWSAQELTETQFRQRQADILHEIIKSPPTGFMVPRTAVAGLLLGVCLMVLSSTLPSTPLLGWLLPSTGTLAFATGAISLTWALVFHSPPASSGRNQPPDQQDR